MAPNDDQILRTMIYDNPWWSRGTVPKHKIPDFHRRDFFKLREQLSSDIPQILGILGPRRVGKTTVMHQLIRHLIGEGVDPKRILFSRMDDAILGLLDSPLDKILDIYFRSIIRESPAALDEECYVFLDEIQSLPKWNLQLKRWFDLDFRIKFVVSGSSSPQIQRSSESLVGRISQRFMMPLKFLEIARHRNMEHDSLLKAANSALRIGFKDSISSGESEPFLEKVGNQNSVFLPIQDEIALILDDYVLRGGYPEIQLGGLSLDETARRLRDQIHLVIYRDIVRVFQIRDPNLMEELIALLAIETSQRANYSNLADTLGAKLDTIKSYVNYLEDVFLVSKSSFYSGSRSSSLRKEKKLSINDPGVRNIAAGTLDEDLLRDSDQVGKIIESIVVDHCKRLAYNLEGKLNTETFYWRSKSQELDIVIQLGRKLIPIEVKYQPKITSSDRKPIKQFMNKYDCQVAFILTKNTSDIVDNVIHMPVWKFLLMC